MGHAALGEGALLHVPTPHVHHVDHHDGGNDGSFRRAGDFDLRSSKPQAPRAGTPFVPTGIFLLGYLVVWSGFSAGVTVLQWRLHETALLTPTMVSASPLLSGATLIAAGIFQLTPLKHVCLQHCRSPLGFLLTNWRDDFRGVFRMGLQHGTYCLGCCWLLMALLFVVGVMNLVWLALLTVFVLVEKVAPTGLYLSRVTGLLLIGAGLWVVAEVVLQFLRH